MNLLALSGSLRAGSSNTNALLAAAMLAPPGVTIERYAGIGTLPHFSPDLEIDPPSSVIDLRARVSRADGLLIACPEYARGIPGAFKNALDWLVGSPDFQGKPVALFNTSPRAFAAQAALRLVLDTMFAVIVPDACITLALLGKETGAHDIVNDPLSREKLARALEAMTRHVSGDAR